MSKVNPISYWWMLIGMPLGWLVIFALVSPATDWHEHADPDNDWRFLLVATVVLGSCLGVICSALFGVMIFIRRRLHRRQAAIPGTG
jgi:hypothetical protein